MEESGEGKNPKALYGTPGLRLLLSLPFSGPGRGVFAPSVGGMIAVRGSNVYRVDSSWNARLVGSMATSNGKVSIDDNGSVAFIVDGSGGYTVDLVTNEFNRILSDGFYGADIVSVLDNYAVFNRPGTNQFYLSGIGSATFDPLDTSTVEGAPGNLVSLIADHGELWLFKTNSTEVYFDSGNTDFPFERRGTYIEHGCAAKHSVIKMDNSIFWLGNDDKGNGIIWRANAYTPVRISTHAIEFAIQGYPRIDDCIAYTYQQEGSMFAVFNFPSGNETWVFDASTNLWHKREWRDPVDNSRHRHRSNGHCFFNGEHVVCDWENGNIYALDLDHYSDNGDPLVSVRTSGPISNKDYLWMYWDSLQVDLEAGVGLQNGQGQDPQMMLEWSDDGGHTWGNQHWTSMGKVGAYHARARWTRKGRGRSRIFRISISDPVKRVILGASAKVSIGDK